MSQIKIEVLPASEQVTVSAPFSHSFVSRAKWLGGEWRAVDRRWFFPIAQELEVRRLCAAVYDSPLPTSEPPKITTGAKRSVLEARAAVLRQELAQIEAELRASR